MKNCIECSQKLRKDEVALCKKLFNVDTEDLYCLSCLAEDMECDIEDLKIKILEFKEQGCELFI